jgi:hypothetical protein
VKASVTTFFAGYFPGARAVPARSASPERDAGISFKPRSITTRCERGPFAPRHFARTGICAANSSGGQVRILASVGC